MQRIRLPSQSAALLAALILMAFPDPANAADPQFDWQPPAFSISDAGGAVFNYPQDLDGPTIILFWASWCPYCKALMPHLQSIVAEAGGAIEVLALNFRDDEDPVAFLDEYGYDFHLLPGADAVAESWNVKGTPGLFLADGTGRVVFDIRAIPPEAFANRSDSGTGELKNYQKAARRAPVWAAELRKAIDQSPR